MKEKIITWIKNHPVWAVVIGLMILGVLIGPFTKTNPQVSSSNSLVTETGNFTKLENGVNGLLRLCPEICLRGTWDKDDLTIVISDQWYSEPEYQQERLTGAFGQAWITLLEESGFKTDTATVYIEDTYGKRLAEFSAVFGFSRED